MVEFAKECHAKHHVYLLSNCIKGVLEAVFEGTDFEDCFDGQFRSCDLGLVKPSKEIFRKVLSLLGNPKDVVFVDDNKTNVEAAEKEGLKGIVFTSISALKEELNRLGY